MTQVPLIVIGFLGMTSVGLGAYGAHGLADAAEGSRAMFVTASHYQMVHSASLLGIYALQRIMAASASQNSSRALKAAFWLQAAGVTLFSGTIYALVLDLPRYGKLAPLGGFAMMGGWGALMLAAIL